MDANPHLQEFLAGQVDAEQLRAFQQNASIVKQAAQAYQPAALGPAQTLLSEPQPTMRALQEMDSAQVGSPRTCSSDDDTRVVVLASCRPCQLHISPHWRLAGDSQYPAAAGHMPMLLAHTVSTGTAGNSADAAERQRHKRLRLSGPQGNAQRGAGASHEAHHVLASAGVVVLLHTACTLVESRPHQHVLQAQATHDAIFKVLSAGT